MEQVIQIRQRKTRTEFLCRPRDVLVTPYHAPALSRRAAARIARLKMPFQQHHDDCEVFTELEWYDGRAGEIIHLRAPKGPLKTVEK